MKKIIILLTLISSLALAKDKMTLLYMEMNYCGWCKKMKKEVFEDDSISSKLHKMYNIKIMKKGDSDIPLNLTTKFYPTTYIISSNGKVIDELPGYMKPKSYLEYLELLSEIENSD
jgi:thioredoxin-related protein